MADVDYTISVSVEGGRLVLRQRDQFPREWIWLAEDSIELAQEILRQQTVTGANLDG